MTESLVVRVLNKGSKWQLKQLLMLFVSYIATGFQTLIIVFVGFEPNFGCKNNTEIAWNNSSLVVSFDKQCNVYNTTTNSSTTCDFQYDIHKHESIVSDWDLICTKAYLSETSQTLYIAGMFVASSFLTPISDRFGRRPLFLAFRFMYILCGFGLAASPNIYCFMAIRFFSGLVGTGMSLVRFVYIMELSPTHLRPLLSVLTGIAWSTSLCLVALVAHLMRGESWRLVQAVGSISTLTVFLDLIFLRESPLWLSTNGKTVEVQKLLLEITKSTSDDISKEVLEECKEKTDENEKLMVDPSVNPPNSPSDLTKSSDLTETKTVPKNKPVSLLDIIKNRTTRLLTIVVCYMWFVNSLVYYGIFFMSSAMSGDRILNFFLSALVEIPANIFLYFCLRYFGRRKPLIGLHGFCAVSLLMGGIFVITLRYETKFIIMRIVTIIGKFGITATYSLIFIYTTELYPTNFRAWGLGIGSTSARIGALMSPFSTVLARKLPWGPGVIFGSLCLILTILMFWTPETRDINLPENIEEVKGLTKYGKKTKDDGKLVKQNTC